MDYYSNIGNATVGSGGVHFNSGHRYLLEVLTIFNKVGRKGDSFFITELLIHESDDQRLPPGFKASWTANWKHDATLGNVKGYLAAANGIPLEDKARIDREITPEVARFASSAANPLKGRMVELSAVGIKTRAGGDFTRHDWSPTTRPANPAISAKHAAEAAATPPPAPPGAGGYPPTVPGSTPALPTAAAPFPPPGWQPHPTSPGWFHNGVEVLSEAQLRQRSAPVAPPPPVAPPLPVAPPPAPFPPAGWQPHPTSPGWFHNGVEVLSEAQLRQRA